MYLIDKKQILNLLDYMVKTESSREEVFGLGGITGNLARERYVEVMISVVLDVGHMLIDGFLMRDAGSYEDILCILVDEKVIPKEDLPALVKLVSLRPELMRMYTELTEVKLQEVAEQSNEAISNFAGNVKAYLDQEASVAHAFGKKE